MKELSKKNHHNHVEIIYADGTHYRLRNVTSVLHDTENGKIIIHTIANQFENIANGVTRSHGVIESVSINVGVLAGLALSHTSKEAMNKYTLHSFLTFVDRGMLVGGVISNTATDEDFNYFDSGESGVGKSFVAGYDDTTSKELIQHDAESFVNADGWGDDHDGTDNTYSIQS